MSYLQLTVADLMTTEPVKVSARDKTAKVLEEMLRSDIHHLPVVDPRGQLIGIVSRRDLVRLPVEEAQAPVRAHMIDEVVTVHAETPACEATLLLLERKIGALPVVDHQGGLVGIITSTDIVRFAHTVLGGDRLSLDDK